MSKPKPPKIKWIKHTVWHWQTRIHGDLLDYWPTKKKWRFRGETFESGIFSGAKDKAVKEFISTIEPQGAEVIKPCERCAFWVRGIGAPNDSDIFGECKLKSTEDDTFYSCENDTCNQFEQVR